MTGDVKAKPKMVLAQTQVTNPAHTRTHKARKELSFSGRMKPHGLERTRAEPSQRSLPPPQTKVENKATARGVLEDFMNFQDEEDVAKNGNQGVIITLDKEECDLGETVQIFYQRIPTERNEVRLPCHRPLD